MARLSCGFATGLIGLFMLLIGLGLLLFGTKSLIRMWAWEKLTLKNGSEAMARWMKPPHPVSLKVYIFNVTNPEEVTEGALPIFTEIGPYVFEEIRDKVNVTQQENYTLSYNLRNMIRFKKRASGRLKITDTVTILNVPLAGAIYTVHETVPEFMQVLDNVWRFFFPGQKNIFIKTTVNEILFEGITMDCSSKETEVYLACRALETRKGYPIRPEGRNFKFSFLYTKNGTSKETYMVNQGVFDLKKSAQFVGVDNSSSVDIWKDEYCNMINGSDGAQFSTMLHKTKRVYIFEKELCRSVYATFEKVIIRNGVYLNRYTNTRDLFASPDENPDNKCFCRNSLRLKNLFQDDSDEDPNDEVKSDEKICYGNGVMSLMPCVGAPLIVSFPHFYLGDEVLLNYTGLRPVKELHETFITIEPNSGLSVYGFKRIQFNLELKRISDLEITSRLPEGIFPIIWVEEGMKLSDEHFKLLRYNLMEKMLLEWGTFVLVGLGSFLIIISYVFHVAANNKMGCIRLGQSSAELQKATKLTKSDSYGQRMRSRAGFRPKSKVSTFQGDVRDLKGFSDDPLFHRHFLTDNFTQSSMVHY